MPDNHLHIISFDIPYPPNYGGIIDVFYMLNALHSSGYKIHLHCFEYGRGHSEVLESYCYTVHYYRRKMSFLNQLSIKPFIVQSRRSDELIRNLSRDNYPILFEGLHSCYFISDKRLKTRLKIYRESNIEHQYYFYLFKAEQRLLYKTFNLVESFRLRIFQSQLRHADLMLVVSKNDQAYLSSRFPENNIIYLPSFHQDDEVTIHPGKGKYALYHGNLSVAENIKAVRFIVERVFYGIDDIPLIISGYHPSATILKFTDHKKNIRLIADPSEEELTALIADAHVNLLITFQPTGLKLKLLHALFRGRFCLVNPPMIEGTELSRICTVKSGTEDLRNELRSLMKIDFSEPMIRERKALLMKSFSNHNNCISFTNLLSLWKANGK